MFSKIIYVLALLCVVNAAVMTDNVFDDDPETEVSSRKAECTFLECDRHCRDRYGYIGTYANCINGRCKCNSVRDRNAKISRAAEPLSTPEEPATLEDCNYQACDQQCHRFGFPGGACVNGRCECDNFRSAEGEIARAAGLLSTPKEPATVEDCYSGACDQHCRNRGFNGGVCVNGRCQCHNFHSTEGEITRGVGPLSIPKEPVALEDCNSGACDQLCRRYGYNGGVCVNGRCQCHNFHGTEGEIARAAGSLSTPKEPATVENCYSGACDQHCRNRGFNGGVCVNGRCQCHNFYSTEGQISRAAQSLSTPEEPATLEDCNSQACDQLCRRYGYNVGVCVNGRCRCHNYRSAEGEISRAAESLSTPEDPANLECCNFQACNQMCRRHGYTGGDCVHGRCKCDDFRSSEGGIRRAAESLSISDEPATLKDCNSQTCYHNCHKDGYNGGDCVYGHCRCHNFHRTEAKISRAAESMSIPEEPATLEDCNYRACDQMCRRYGFTGGACVNGRCKCDNFLYSEEPTTVSDTTKVEDEESHLILKTDIDKVILPTIHACDAGNCNELCRVLNYAGGTCTNGVCSCY